MPTKFLLSETKLHFCWMEIPLAERMRPTDLDSFVGQQNLIGPNGPIRRMIASKRIPSIIFWGPPGVGKTTLANILAKSQGSAFYTLSAINSGVKDVREVIQKASTGGMFNQNTPILFIDEIHRFSKSQQDSLLGAVEKGVITLIGATTENPSFEVISALLSRCQVYTLNSLDKEDLRGLLARALEQDSVLKKYQIEIREDEALLSLSGGDARKLLNTLDNVVQTLRSQDEIVITNEVVSGIIQQSPLKYDKNGEQHYDIVSAYIKSIRGSDPNGAVYWLARMIEGGEDPKFIARRLLIAASEDIGLANPTALIIANNAFQAVQAIGFPEARIILSQATIYLASSAKSNSAYEAINRAQQVVRETGDLPVPLHLRNAPTELMKELDYGAGYVYPHDHPNQFTLQEYMPDALHNHRLYTPKINDRENALRKFLNFNWKGKYEY